MEDLIYRLKKRAEIRSQISTRKSVQEGKPDRIAELLLEAAARIEALEASSAAMRTSLNELIDQRLKHCGTNSKRARDGSDGRYERARNALNNDAGTALYNKINDYKEELQRVYQLPDLEWAIATANIFQELANISRAGYTVNAQRIVKDLDAATVYVNRLKRLAEDKDE